MTPRRCAILGRSGAKPNHPNPGQAVSLAVSTNVLAALTGSASGGLTIAL